MLLEKEYLCCRDLAQSPRPCRRELDWWRLPCHFELAQCGCPVSATLLGAQRRCPNLRELARCCYAPTIALGSRCQHPYRRDVA